ncbi:hypothetical protein DICPUDRAFT_53543 [Dictyostelium purpureum]|uniref:Uncharacterized protein n=1 Tax=Dictyostelium purpureum TaxID=5786 RepID=F0ZDE3_DICPU|nr:uncharacterized protein DICPUDRAFT_53543 [Dictyostelium purpureum]EGC38052.1 hypothetical protein DICPUDRAFT_53543 [Dictyostelium purpureum]|eukprot:XP_003285453.1 hypothetical protein DICPUDRAFT_53543 [Dictyostelium purpureum]
MEPIEVKNTGKIKLAITQDLVQYTIDHSNQLNEVQKELILFTRGQVERPQMLTTADQVVFFQFLIKILNAKKVIDVGVYTGLSSLSAALALPADGKVVSCDVSDEFTQHARKFWAKAGVADKINLKIQPAGDTLQELIDNGESGTFDFIFIDADKTSYDLYYELGLQLIRKGGVIAIDNVLQDGRVLDLNNNEPNVTAIRKINEKIRDDSRVSKSMLPFADGITLVTKN